MTIRSSIPAVVAAVLSTISTAVAGQTDNIDSSPVEVVDGEVGTHVAAQYIQIIGVSGASQQWASVGKSRRNETYDITGTIRVYVGSDDQAYTRQRCFDLFALIETALDNDPFVGGVVNGSVQSVATDLRMGVTDSGGRAAELDFILPVVTQLIAS